MVDLLLTLLPHAGSLAVGLLSALGSGISHLPKPQKPTEFKQNCKKRMPHPGKRKHSRTVHVDIDYESNTQ